MFALPSSSMDSRDKKKRETLTNDNRFEQLHDLPEALIHHIFSFLDAKQVIQTSVLSKRYETLWKSIPSLHFNQELWRDRTSMVIDRSKFKHFVHKVLRRRGNSNIQNLSIHIFDFENEDDGYVNHLILSALKRHHVEEILLERVLLRPFSYLGHVKSVELKSVYLSAAGCVDNEFLFDLPLVEKFVLYLPSYSNLPEKQTLVVNGPNLKFLVVRSDDLFHKPNCGIKIRAENVVYLQLTGSMFDDYDLGQLDCLETVVIDLVFREAGMMITCLEKLLSGVYNAKALTMSLYSSLDSRKFPEEMKHLPMSFLNLKYLKVTRWRKYGDVGPLRDLLKHFPSLETLVLESLILHDLAEEADWETQFQSIFSQLKTIEIVDPERCDREGMFIRYLLQKATGLKNITITLTEILSCDQEKALIDFCKVLQHFDAFESVMIRLMVRGKAGMTILFEEPSNSLKSPSD